MKSKPFTGIATTLVFGILGIITYEITDSLLITFITCFVLTIIVEIIGSLNSKYRWF